MLKFTETERELGGDQEMTLLEGGKAQPSFPTPRLVPVSLHHTPSHNLSVLRPSSGVLWEEFCALPLIRPGWRQMPEMGSLPLKCSGVQGSFHKRTRNAWLRHGPQSLLHFAPRRSCGALGAFFPSVHSLACSSPFSLGLLKNDF